MNGRVASIGATHPELTLISSGKTVPQPLGVTRQSIIKMWLAERLQQQGQSFQSPPGNHLNIVGLEVLSQRERQVLELVAQGSNNQQIGDSLGLSPKTIARHRERIMKKLNMHSRTELVKFAIRTGLVKLN